MYDVYLRNYYFYAEKNKCMQIFALFFVWCKMCKLFFLLIFGLSFDGLEFSIDYTKLLMLRISRYMSKNNIIILSTYLKCINIRQSHL